MTIENIFRRDEISILTRNICMANQIKTFDDLKLYYIKSRTFINLRYCDEKSNDELTAVYNKYKEVYIGDKTTQPSVSINKSEVKLEDVVTDLDEVIKTTHIADAYLEEIKQKLEDYWSKNREKVAPQNKNLVSSIKTFSNVTDVVDLEETKQTIEDYRRKQASEETTKNDAAESSVKSTSESTDAISLEHEQRPRKHRREKVNVEVKENDAKSKSIFGRHPSKKINDLYLIKNYQGTNPMDAKVIFVGRDPNWAADIDEKKMFESVVEYLTDGVTFWKTHGIHHPFLLKSYKGDGRKYHRNFSKLNLDSSVASKVSFVELVGFPTTGMAGSNVKLFRAYLFSEENKEHLIELDKILSNNDKVIFIAWGLINDFKLINQRTGLFEKFAKLDKSKMDITDLNEYENIFIHRHFSDAISNATIEKMENKVRESF